MLHNERGNVMLISLAVVAAAVIGVIAFSDAFRSAITQQKKFETIDVLQVVEESIIGTIENDAAWKQTITSAGLGCLSADGNVCQPGSSPINVYLADGTQLLSSGNDSLGFDYFGTPCTGFNPTTPNDNCPFKFVVTWTPVCAGACSPTLISPLTGVPMEPPVQINILLRYSGTNKTVSSINLNQRFKKQFNRGELAGTLAAACRSAGGDFDAKVQKCRFQSRSCPTGEVLNGFDATGQPTCISNPFLDKTCGSGFAPHQIAAGGHLKCWKF